MYVGWVILICETFVLAMFVSASMWVQVFIWLLSKISDSGLC